ncbi:LysR family transcriptional regulator [Loktanella sp. F6476L]|uniref:LysR family transcriptional regulator n=1 Tax=Loktanella sp. F6476L TaxID=2926405 RepID=UPI001FF68717|nr:LysR family transcriptional regulator [Loktanella sp. F6476L]MCK0119994.1 LysR family transcriptional regulator [Loktanella sp. F6476L]
MDNWDEIRTAYQVARNGTVSGAADVLGVHHATVIRHIDALEQRLGVKLFQRHARGYAPTEAGTDLLQVAKATDDQFSQLVSRIKGLGESVSGELVVTSLLSFSQMLAPMLAQFQTEHPDIRIRFLTGERLFRLEYGEAHVAIRAGAMAPDQPDNVVQPLMETTVQLVASEAYIARFGMPDGVDDFHNHRFVGYDNVDHRAPFARWLAEIVPKENFVYRATDERALQDSILAGAGIGFVVNSAVSRYPTLIPVIAPIPEWNIKMWLVTHVDLHRTTKVQTFLSFVKGYMKNCDL